MLIYIVLYSNNSRVNPYSSKNVIFKFTCLNWVYYKCIYNIVFTIGILQQCIHSYCKLSNLQ